MTAAIEVENLSKRFGRAEVLRDVSLRVEPGEYLGLVGVNGAGKTTLIKSLLDFSRPDGGTIRICGVTYTHAAARAPLAFLPERFVAPGFATGRDFLAYMARLYDPGFMWAGLDEVLAVLDLDAGALARPVRTLSKGMAQKLGLLACLLSGRRLLVLDEPFSGLDPKARALLKRHLLNARKDGTTVFFSSHALADVEALCDRIAVLHAGRLAYCGPLAAFRRHFDATTAEEAYLRCVS